MSPFNIEKKLAINIFLYIIKYVVKKFIMDVIVHAVAINSIDLPKHAPIIKPTVVILEFNRPTINKYLVALQDCHIPPDVDNIIWVAKDIDNIWNGFIALSQLSPKKIGIISEPEQYRYIERGKLIAPMIVIILLYF